MLMIDELRRMVTLRRELRQALAELEVCSTVSAVAGKGSRDTSEDIGGKRPTGVTDDHPERHELEDWRAWPLKPVEHYRRRVERAASATALESVLRDVRRAIERMRRQPAPLEPVLGDPQWKRWVAESSEPASEIARRFHVSKRYVNKVRAQWRGRVAA